MTYEYYSKVLYFKKVESGKIDHFYKRAKGNHKRRTHLKNWLKTILIDIIYF